jgi:hypothetical protein
MLAPVPTTGTVKASVQVFPQESVNVTAKGMSVPTGQAPLMVNLKALAKLLEYNKYALEADEYPEVVV